MSSITRRSFSGLVSLGMAGLASPRLAGSSFRRQEAAQQDDDVMLTPRTPIIITGGSVLIDTDLDLDKPTKSKPKEHEYVLNLDAARTYRINVMELGSDGLIYHPDEATGDDVSRRLLLYTGNNQNGLNVLSLSLPSVRSGDSRTMTLKGAAFGRQSSSNGRRRYRGGQEFHSYRWIIGGKALDRNGMGTFLITEDERIPVRGVSPGP
jgi:hypothetical protein